MLPSDDFPWDIIIGVATIGGVLLVLILVLTAVYRHHIVGARRVTKKLLDEMEKMEDSMEGKIRDGELPWLRPHG